MDLKEFYCPVCDSVDNKKTLVDRPDYEYNIKYDLTYLKCLNKQCGLVFVKEVPDAKEIESFYKSYTTHISNLRLRYYSFFARINRRIYLNDIKSLFENKNLSEIQILDYGCGNGNLIQDLINIGAQQVTGYDFDPAACEYAQKQGLPVFSSFDVASKQGPFDFIFLNHVIEHLMNPIDDIKKLATFLKKGGKVIIRTPNNESFLSDMFKDNWRGWETPRHLHIFNTKSIKYVPGKVNDIKLNSVTTSNLIFTGIFNESFHSNFYRNTLMGKISRKVLTTVCYLSTLLVNFALGNKGEELCTVFEKI